ncbi:hypothetical protein D9C01_13760, partial [Corynebacterium diphtheriae]
MVNASVTFLTEAVTLVAVAVVVGVAMPLTGLGMALQQRDRHLQHGVHGRGERVRHVPHGGRDARRGGGRGGCRHAADGARD